MSNEIFFGQFMPFDRCIELSELRADILWAEELPHGGALHILVEDGDVEDAGIEYCINRIESGEYEQDLVSEGASVESRDIPRQLKIVKHLQRLTFYERQMVNNGTTMTEEVFDYLFNHEVCDGG